VDRNLLFFDLLHLAIEFDLFVFIISDINLFEAIEFGLKLLVLRFVCLLVLVVDEDILFVYFELVLVQLFADLFNFPLFRFDARQ
jgi:hypothetical protein